ncbi:hypothetical protein DUI87_16475 [Hirundo rustica rustica]|uniref:Reverse transcriptase domain-containing protein n=1 Tax=Hirundo rustica rustica TaxID=333673 RepID=A0A3M0K1A4_HIRRU|nr:hypothetical protein DUI87_16475 [Hirundo rustica rustica]
MGVPHWVVGGSSGEIGRTGKEGVLYVMEDLEYMKLKVGSGTVERLWLRELGKVLLDWKLSNVQIFKKGKKDNPGNYRPVSFNSVIVKIMEKTIHRGIEKHLKNNAVIDHDQHEFMMEVPLVKHNFFFDKMSCSIILITFIAPLWTCSNRSMSFLRTPELDTALQVPETRRIIWRKEDEKLVEKNHVREYLSKPDIHKSIIHEGIHPQFLRELADLIERKVNVIPVFSQGKEEYPGAIDSEMTVLADEGRAAIIYSNFSKIFHAVSFKILIDRLMKYGLYK